MGEGRATGGVKGKEREGLGFGNVEPGTWILGLTGGAGNVGYGTWDLELGMGTLGGGTLETLFPFQARNQ